MAAAGEEGGVVGAEREGGDAFAGGGQGPAQGLPGGGVPELEGAGVARDGDGVAVGAEGEGADGFGGVAEGYGEDVAQHTRAVAKFAVPQGDPAGSVARREGAPVGTEGE